MLINLSNHNSSLWDKAQLQNAIDLYGDIIDVDFPTIDPNATEGDITTLSLQYCRLIMDFNEKYASIAVHIMGESTFCFTLIKQLQGNNIECIASTTKRDVFIDDNGNKISRFKFVKFRRYE